MGDAYWRYAGDRHQSATLASHLAKRPRSDHEIPSGLGISSYFPREDERGGLHVVRDTDSINASYDRYLRNAQISHGGESGRSMSVGLGGLRHLDDPRTSPRGASDPVVIANDLSMGLGGRSKISLPPDASCTLFVEGLPANCTRREVAHIFRPFVGYKEVRLVNKGSRHSGGDPLVLCFVDFQTPAHAATAMDALKGDQLSKRISALLSTIYGDEKTKSPCNFGLMDAKYHHMSTYVTLLVITSLYMKQLDNLLADRDI